MKIMAMISVLIKPEKDYQYEPSVKHDNLTKAGNAPTWC